MRALLITCSARHPKLPLRFFGDQIVAGPTWPDAQTLHGRWRSLRAPWGDYDVADLLGKIPTEQKPDVIVYFGDSAATSRPCNLQAFTGRKIMALGRGLNAELNQPTLAPYLSVERFDHIVAVESDAALRDLLNGERDRLLETARGAHAFATAMDYATAAAC